MDKKRPAFFSHKVAKPSPRNCITCDSLIIHV